MEINSLISRNDPESKQLWEHFAEVDPLTYILTSLKTRDPREFWDSGERTVRQELLPVFQSRGVRTRLAMELGCGLGRLAFPMSRHFAEVVGVDIAREMIRQATSLASENGVGNVSFAAVSGPKDLFGTARKYAGSVDFLYSLLVFQHIPDFAIISGYIQVIGVLLEEHGLAYLQFDTRERDLAYRLKTSLPDFLLPRFWRRGIRRVRRSTKELEASFAAAGLQILEQSAPRSAYHRYLVKKFHGATTAI